VRKRAEVIQIDLYEEVTARIEDLEEDPDNIRLENSPDTVAGLSRALEHFGRFDVAPRVWKTDDGKLRALAGSGRVRAAKKARSQNGDLQEIPVIRLAAPKDRKEKVFMQFSENALRDVLGPVDYGRGFKMLADEGLTYDEIVAELTSRGVLPKSRTKQWVSQMIQLTELHPDVQVMVNRSQVGVWQALQLSQLPTAGQKVAAQRIATQNLSRADVRQLIASAAGQLPAEALLEETRDSLREAAVEREDARRSRSEGRDPSRRSGPVTSSWSLPALPSSELPLRPKLAALQRLEWYREKANAEQKALALEAVSGGHSPAIAAELVQRAAEEAPAASPALRELLVSLSQLHRSVDELQQEKGTAPAEFARLRLRSMLKVLDA
jgi:hypothetical protein